MFTFDKLMVVGKVQTMNIAYLAMYDLSLDFKVTLKINLKNNNRPSTHLISLLKSSDITKIKHYVGLTKKLFISFAMDVNHKVFTKNLCNFHWIFFLW
jgi:hypothetical protein